MVNVPGHGKAYAEHVASPASHLAKARENASFEEAAASTRAALTALQVLKPRLKDGGTIVSLPTHEFSEELKALAAPRNLKLEFVMVTSNGDDMNALKELIEAGTLKPHVSATFPFEKLTDVHLQIESGRTVGKAVVTVWFKSVSICQDLLCR